jgi:hypothetical protein
MKGAAAQARTWATGIEQKARETRPHRVPVSITQNPPARGVGCEAVRRKRWGGWCTRRRRREPGDAC